MNGPPFHIKAKPGDIAENIIVVGDPARTRILGELLEEPRIVNENRGLLVMTGKYGDVDVTIATHGIGCPSAMIVFEELGMLGGKRMVRIGTAGGLVKELEIGDIVVATAALYTMGGCGLAQYLPGACGPTAPHPILTARIIEELDKNGLKHYIGPVYSSDAFYAEDPGFAEKWGSRGVVAVEMEAAGLFSLGWIHGWETAAVLVISDNLVSGVEYLASTEELKERFIEVSRIVLNVFKQYYK